MSGDRVDRMRAAVLRMVFGVVAVDTVALTIWFMAGVGSRPEWRTPMVVVWLLATLAVVLPGLRAIRMARRG